jgi:hypothetical protein
MMYLPYKSDQREEAIKLMVDIFALVLPEKVAEEVVRKDVKLTYDPATDELKRIPVILKRSLRERNNLRIRLGLVVG